MAKNSIAESTYYYIRDQILAGRWKAGDRINDLELAEELQVSRLSVREALFKLTETGIIEKSHWKGYFLQQITKDVIENIIEIRIALETVAVENLINECSDDIFDIMEKTIDDSEVYLKKGDNLNYLKTDFRFHELIYENQHNSYITNTMNNYMLIIHCVRYNSMGKDESFIETAGHSITCHRNILNQLRLRNISEAQRVLVEHLLMHKSEAEENLSV